jgi:hypothetical protein
MRNFVICVVAIPVDFVFLIYSTMKLTLAGFGFLEAFRYSLQRGGGF